MLLKLTRVLPARMCVYVCKDSAAPAHAHTRGTRTRAHRTGATGAVCSPYLCGDGGGGCAGAVGTPMRQDNKPKI